MTTILSIEYLFFSSFLFIFYQFNLIKNENQEKRFIEIDIKRKKNQPESHKESGSRKNK